MYPASVRSAFARQIEAEQILEQLAAAVLEEWAPYAQESFTLSLTAAGDARSWWNVLWDAVYTYGAGLLYGDTMQRAANALGIDFPPTPPGAVADTPPPLVPPGPVNVAALNKRAAGIVAKVLGKTPNPNPPFTVRKAQTAYLQTAANRYANVPDEVFAMVRRDIDNALAAGENPEQSMQTRVEQSLSRHLTKPELAKTARMIARTESASAQSKATLDVAKANTSTGTSDLVKTWISTLDEVTRPSHRRAHKQTVEINAPFKVGGHDVDHPGDGPASESRNCRCACFVLRRDEPLPDIPDMPDLADDLPLAASATPLEDTVTTYRTFTATLTELGTMTDDFRMLAADMTLTFRSFPLALRWQETADPGHDHAYTVGVIEHAELQGSKVVATGYLLNTPQADEAASQIEHGVTRPSVDLGAATSIFTDEAGNEIDLDEWFESGEDVRLVETVTEGKVLGATLVSIAAFDRPTDIELTGTKDVSDELVDAIAASAAFAHRGVVASGERHFSDDFRPRRELFDNPNLNGFTHPTYDEATGRVYGHIAPFGRQHTGFAGQARKVEAPRSDSGYAYFHTSKLTDSDGNSVIVGKLTVACGHAGLKLAGEPAAAHYDDTGTCWAYVRAGEDAHGIWFSGVLHPSADDEMVRDGLASPLSGDWRPINPPGLELVAALSVNTPGFPLVASATNDDGEVLALVAALAPRRITAKAQEGTTMAEAAPMPPAGDDDAAEADVKFPKGTKVRVKETGDEKTVNVVKTDQTVYQMDDSVTDGPTWFLEGELEPVEEPAAEPASPEAVAAAVMSALDARDARLTQAANVKTAIGRVMSIRSERAKSLIAKAGR